MEGETESDDDEEEEAPKKVGVTKLESILHFHS